MFDVGNWRIVRLDLSSLPEVRSWIRACNLSLDAFLSGVNLTRWGSPFHAAGWCEWGSRWSGHSQSGKRMLWPCSPSSPLAPACSWWIVSREQARACKLRQLLTMSPYKMRDVSLISGKKLPLLQQRFAMSLLTRDMLSLCPRLQWCWKSQSLLAEESHLQLCPLQGEKECNALGRLLTGCSAWGGPAMSFSFIWWGPTASVWMVSFLIFPTRYRIRSTKWVACTVRCRLESQGSCELSDHPDYA